MSEITNDLEDLGVKLVDQDQLENSITKKANEALINNDTELDKKRLEKTNKDLSKTLSRIRILQKRLENPKTKLSQRKLLKDEIAWYEENELKPLQQDLKDITDRLSESKRQLIDSQNSNVVDSKAVQLPGESEKDYLIRTGKITAFGNKNAFSSEGDSEEAKSHMFLRQPGFEIPDFVDDSKKVDEVFPDIKEDDDDDDDDDDESEPPLKRIKIAKDENMSNESEASDLEYNLDDESDGNAEDFEINAPEIGEDVEYIKATPLKKEARNIDDGDELNYQTRLRSWTLRRSSLRGNNSDKDESDEPEWRKPHPTIPDAVLNSNFRLPGDIYPSLFDYQKTCVQWLWELYSQKTGGIIGDEMGLGKTIQIISFIAGLHYSGQLDGPVLVVVPATVLNQWVNEFHKWWPPLRCIILHSIGTGMNTVSTEEKLEEFLENKDPNAADSSLKNIKSQINAKELVERVVEKGHVLITTYVGLRIYSKYILPKKWGYCILDEGHKIRNPNLDISLTCKQIKTYNRIILSGTPIQNNLIELWSLFDFVFPGRLGTLPVFEQQFAIPINMGGYANASNVQVQTGYKCAVILRDLISPYLLRRLKSSVARDLPKKNEMVLFVKLTRLQQDLYEKFLLSEDLNAILKGKRNVLMGVDILRKICNHPDLVYRDHLKHKENYGSPSKSGKMQVLKNLLQLWEMQEHKVLLFCQTKQMLDILEKFIKNLKVLKRDENIEEIDKYFTYLRMDGSTPISKRQNLVDQFNSDPSLNVFLLTTKVGGLGVNLTGADRVIIYDPDWNPSTDLQARERAWRLGQKKDITIYRLMTAGSIEEKIYHRQIFKTFLTNKILHDPKQRRFFKINDLHDLFTLGDQNEVGTETGGLFNGKEKIYSGNKERKSNKLLKKHENDDDFYEVASIAGVSKLDNFEGDKDTSKDKENNENDAKAEENRIMEDIFANNIHSALKHDDIVDSSSHDVSIVEREANKIANEAAEALKQSRKLARKNAVGVPTWTGKFGLAGKFGPKKKSSLSSTSILKELKEKKEGKVSIFSKNSASNKENSSDGEDRKALMKSLIDFLNSQENHFSDSNSILKSLKVSLKDESKIILIRSMLREVAMWEKPSKGWKLKTEFEDGV